MVLLIEPFINLVALKNPEVLYFNVDSLIVNRNKKVLLRWHVRHVRKVWINEVEYPSRGQKEIAFEDGKTFSLVAVNKKGAVIAKEKVVPFYHQINIKRVNLALNEVFISLPDKIIKLNNNVILPLNKLKSGIHSIKLSLSNVNLPQIKIKKSTLVPSLKKSNILWKEIYDQYNQEINK